MREDIKINIDVTTLAKMLKLSENEGLTLSQWADIVLSQEIGHISCDGVESQVNFFTQKR